MGNPKEEVETVENPNASTLIQTKWFFLVYALDKLLEGRRESSGSQSCGDSESEE